MRQDEEEKQLQPGANGALGRLYIHMSVFVYVWCVCVCVIYKTLLAFANYLYGSRRNQLGEHQLFYLFSFIFQFKVFFFFFDLFFCSYLEFNKQQIGVGYREKKYVNMRYVNMWI